DLLVEAIGVGGARRLRGSARSRGSRQIGRGRLLRDPRAAGETERHHRDAKPSALYAHGGIAVVTITDARGPRARARHCRVTVVSRLSGTSTSQSQPSGTLSDG